MGSTGEIGWIGKIMEESMSNETAPCRSLGRLGKSSSYSMMLG